MCLLLANIFSVLVTSIGHVAWTYTVSQLKPRIGTCRVLAFPRTKTDATRTPKYPRPHISGGHRNTGTQEGYWTKATRPIYPDLDCRCGAERTSFREEAPWRLEVVQKLLACPMFVKTILTWRYTRCVDNIIRQLVPLSGYSHSKWVFSAVKTWLWLVQFQVVTSGIRIEALL